MAPHHATSLPFPAAPRPGDARRCAAEILDTLPANSPAAARCRRDLRLINLVMGNTAWITRALLPRVRPGDRVLEIGAGDGALGLSLQLHGVHVEGLDRAPRPAAWPGAHAWHQADIREFRDWDRATIVVGNLIFHHFTDAELHTLGHHLRQHARAIVAVEPLRSGAARRLFALLCGLIGAHRYTRHDGAVSIAAGFRGDELPRALGLSAHEWSWRIDTTWRGAYRFVAERRSAAR